MTDNPPAIPSINLDHFAESSESSSGFEDEETSPIIEPLDSSSWGSDGSSDQGKNIPKENLFTKKIKKDKPFNGFKIELRSINNAAKLGLDISMETFSLFIQLKSLLNMAELRYLEQKTDEAVLYWKLCAEHLYTFFLDGPSILLSGGPPFALEKVLNLVKRAARMLLCLDGRIINQNLRLLDSLIVLESEIEESMKRYINPMITAQSSSPAASYNSNSRRKRNTFKTQIKTMTGRRSNREDISPLNISPDEDSDSNILSPLEKAQKETSWRLWGYIQYMKNQTRNFTDKKISKDELRSRNEKCIRKMIRTATIARTHDYEQMNANNTIKLRKAKARRTLSSIPKVSFRVTNNDIIANMKTPDPTFEELASRNGILNTLFYAIMIDSHIIYYVPSTHGMQLQRFGEPSYLFNSDYDNEFMYVKLSVYQYAENMVLEVPSHTTLDEIMHHLNGNTPEDSKLSQLSQTQHFRNLLLHIKENNDPSNINFAKKYLSGNDVTLLPIVDCWRKRLYEIISPFALKQHSRDNPVKLYIYTEETPNFLFSNSLSLTSTSVKKLASLISTSSRSRFNSDVLNEYRKNFSPLLNTLSPIMKRNSSWSDEENADEMTVDSLLCMVCSKSLSVFPWELILDDDVLLRSFTLHDVMNGNIAPSTKKYPVSPARRNLVMKVRDKRPRSGRRKGRYTEVDLTSTLLLGYQSECSITSRTGFTLNNVFKDLSIGGKKYMTYNSNYCATFPLTNPLFGNSSKKNIDKAKRKLVEKEGKVIYNLYDIDNLQSPKDIYNIFCESYRGVFIFSYTDMLEMSEAIISLKKLGEKEITPIIFIPSKETGNVLEKLGEKVMNDQAQWNSRYEYLVTIFKRIEKELNIPICIYNANAL
eukprot:TRINITY_DN2309_c0_g1_i3.p1 TRINITY_DN2309_c0_g1~~TRINITY_DN2309_c0_g1_i3.p1  ORF type:complete len:875 (+),score=170.29 TRINITY_DN2309_c0_g1_i3:504-3128(+)